MRAPRGNPCPPSWWLLQALVLLLATSATATDMFELSPLRCDPCIDRPAYTLRAIVHGTAADPFWQGLRAAAVQSARDLRVALDFPLYDAFDPARMARDIRAAAAAHVGAPGAADGGGDRPDALVVTIPSPAVEAAVAEAVAHGVPVFGMNSGYRVAEIAGALGFVAMDERLGGAAAAEEFLLAFGGGAGTGNSTGNLTRAAFINHEKGNGALDARREGLVAGLALGDQAVDEIVVDLAADGASTVGVQIQLALEGCPYDAVLLGGGSLLETATAALVASGCALERGTLLGSFDTGGAAYAALATGRLAFAISQQSHLQGALSVLLAATYVTTGKRLARSAESESGVWLSGPKVINLRNLPSDTLQTCEEAGFPVCPNTLAPDGVAESQCQCTDRSEIVIAGVLHGVTTDSFWDVVFEQAGQAADDLGITLKLDRLEPQPSAEVWHAKMANKMISYCREGVDGLFVTIPSAAVATAVRECQALNVPVMSINSGAELAIELGLVHHISQLEHSAGFGAGKRLGAAGITEGVCLNYAAGNSAIAERCQGFEAALREDGIAYSGMVMVPRDNEIVFIKDVEAALADRGADDDWDGVGILTVSPAVIPETLAVKERHPAVLIGSFDTSEGLFDAIEQGTVLFGIDQNPFIQGYMPVWLLTLLAQTKQSLRNTFIETGPLFVDAAPDEALVACVANNFKVCPPQVTLTLNQLTSIRPVGLTFAAIIFLASLFYGGWTFYHRKKKVVIKSQPLFLGMICIGTLLMGSAIIPLSIDDSIATPEACTKSCMAAPWLFCIGFTTSFAAVFSKIWRLNRIVASARTSRRIKLESKNVLGPFIVLLTLNIIFLLVWTLIDPMHWERQPTYGSEDGLSSFGVCVLGRTGVSTAMVSCLVALALCVVVLANYEAYKARDVSVEFSESKYVALAMICFLQVIVVGAPLIALVHTNPPAGYFVKAAIITVLSLSLLFLIFIPKQMFLREETRKNNEKSETLSAPVANNSSFSIVDEENNSYAVGDEIVEPVAADSNSNSVSVVAEENKRYKVGIDKLKDVLKAEGIDDADSLFDKAGLLAVMNTDRSGGAEVKRKSSSRSSSGDMPKDWAKTKSAFNFFSSSFFSDLSRFTSTSEAVDRGSEDGTSSRRAWISRFTSIDEGNGDTQDPNEEVERASEDRSRRSASKVVSFAEDLNGGRSSVDDKDDDVHDLKR